MKNRQNRPFAHFRNNENKIQNYFPTVKHENNKTYVLLFDYAYYNRYLYKFNFYFIYILFIWDYKSESEDSRQP